MSNEDNRFSARAARYMRVGTNVGSVAAKVAGQRLFGIEGDRSRQAAELAAALGGLKGPLMKVAQLLSTIPEALPPEYARELGQLQSQAPPMGPAFVRRRMMAELGSDWRGRFQSFEETSTASASLGQVHRATALDGRPLACKLQYPDMQSAVEADLNQLRIVFALHARMDPAVDTTEILKEISARLREELDYDLEARHTALAEPGRDLLDLVGHFGANAVAGQDQEIVRSHGSALCRWFRCRWQDGGSRFWACVLPAISRCASACPARLPCGWRGSSASRV